jgi:hypothetical protein
MFRTLTISLFSVAAVATLNAGQIQLGGTNGLITSVATSPGTAITGYVTTGCQGASDSYQPGIAFTGCVPVSTTLNGSATFAPPATPPNPSILANSSTSVNWVNRVFSTGVLQTPTLTGTATSPITSIPAPATSITANGVTFDTSNAPSGTGTAAGIADFGFNSSGAQTGGLYAVTLPVGVYDVDQVWTMIQDFWGTVASGNTTEVDFEFGSKSDGSGTNIFDDVTLTPGGQIRSGVQCSAGCSGTNSSPIVTTLDTTSHTGQGTQGDVTLSAANLYTQAYTGIGTAGQYNGSTSGNVVLDDQSFYFGNAYATDYLVSITIKNQMTPGVSKDFISAVTVDQVTPEPSSVLLFLAGLGSIGVAKLRRKRS